MVHTKLATILAGWSTEEVGPLVGGMLATLGVIIGAIKCVLIMRRATTSKVCVASLLLVLLSWVVSFVGNAASRGAILPREIVLVASASLCALLALAALILGIVGLATYDRQRFVQGRAQAIWAIVLSGLLLVALAGGLVIGLVKAARVRGVAEPTAPFDGRPIEKPEFNFSLTPPPRWVSMKPETVNKLACLALRRTRPEVFCVVIGERTSGEIDLELLKEVSKSNLAGAARVLRQSETEVLLNGQKFAHVTSRARMDADAANTDLVFEHWLSTHRGFSWQIIFWSPAGGARALAQEARSVMESFRVLDLTKDGGGAGNLQDVDRPGLGYATHLAGMGWNEWTNKTQQNAQVDFGVQRLHEALLVLPVCFDGEAPDLEALTRALLHTLEFRFPSEGDYETKPWRPAHDGEGLELTTERDVDGDRIGYVLRVARAKACAHLLAGWAVKPSGDLELVRRSLDTITLRLPQDRPSSPSAEQRADRGILFNQAGLSYFVRKDYEGAARWFRQAFEQTKADPTMLENLGNALESAGRHAEGKDYLALNVGKFPNSFDVAVRYARLEALSGDVKAGNETFLGLIERDLKSEDEFLSWLTLLVDRNEHPAARLAAEAWMAKHPTVNARRWHAQTVFESGDEEGALVYLEKLAAEQPDDLKVAYDLGEYSNRAGEHAKAAAIADRLLAGGKEPPRALVMLGWSQMGRKWYREAKATFERAAKQNPDDEDIQDAIRQASASLGQGTNSDIKQPIEPVALPPELRQELAATPPVDFGKEHAAVWLLRATGYRFEKGKPLRKTLYRRVKVLSAKGANDFSSMEIAFDPLGERIFMNRLEVKDPEGRVVIAGSVDDAYVRDLQDGTATHRKVLHVQAPGLQPDYVLEMEISLEDRAPAESFPFERHLMAYSLPAASEAIFIVGDVPLVKAETAQGDGLKTLRTTKLAAWIAHGLPAAPDEPLAVWAERRSPMLWLAGEEGGWTEVARAYLKQIEDRLQPDKAAAELAAALTDKLKTEREKVAVLARHVQRQIGYQAIEFGVRARRPISPTDTLKQRFGDCKDHALLLHQLLGAAGIPSHLALVNTDWRIQPRLPSLDQFNHMVVHVPALGPGWLVDATDKHLQLDAFPADHLWHAHALVLDPANPRLLPPSPDPAPAGARVESRRTVTPDGNDWSVEEAFTLHGYYAAWMRAAFAGRNNAEQAQKAQNILAGHGAAQVQGFSFDALDDPSQPARLLLTYTVRNALMKSNGKATAALPAFWERDYLGVGFVKERRTAFARLYPFRFTSEVTVKLPAPASESSLAALAQRAAGEFCAWKLEAAPALPGRPELSTRFEFEATPCEYPAVRYAGFHEAWEVARRAWERTIEWDQK